MEHAGDASLSRLPAPIARQIVKTAAAGADDELANAAHRGGRVDDHPARSLALGAGLQSATRVLLASAAAAGTVDAA